jgi:hypothetical protein
VGVPHEVLQVSGTACLRLGQKGVIAHHRSLDHTRFPVSGLVSSDVCHELLLPAKHRDPIQTRLLHPRAGVLSVDLWAEHMGAPHQADREALGPLLLALGADPIASRDLRPENIAGSAATPPPILRHVQVQRVVGAAWTRRRRMVSNAPTPPALYTRARRAHARPPISARILSKVNSMRRSD